MVRIAELSNQRWFTPAFRERRPDVLSRTTRSLLQQRGAFHASIWDMIAGLELEAALRSVSCPTLVITGEKDINAPPSAAESIAKAIPDSSLRILPGIGHFPPFEDPDSFNRMLKSFVDDIK